MSHQNPMLLPPKVISRSTTLHNLEIIDKIPVSTYYKNFLQKPFIQEQEWTEQ